MDFVVCKDDLRTCRIDEAMPAVTADLAPGQVRLRVDSFALTANNITYAAFGDLMSYWRFFPAPDGWGRIPVWGFADVEASAADGIAVGERVFGYLPMSTDLVVDADRIKPGGFIDAAPHRSGLPVVYNQYERVAATPGYAPDREAEQSLLRPLFTTSFLIDDFLADNDLFGASTVYVSSASSKTSLGLAHLLSHHQRCEVVGLTSASNTEFVERVGYYDRVVTYGDVAESVRADTGRAASGAVFVDMAGDGQVVADVHRGLGEQLRHSCRVGATHWEDLAPQPDLPGPAPELFFAPAQVEKRRADWGPGGFEQRFAGAWTTFLDSVDPWLEVVAVTGPDDVTAAYLDVLEGRTQPERGLILSL